MRKPGFLPPGFRLSLPFWGARPELAEVITLARWAAPASWAAPIFPLHSPGISPFGNFGLLCT